MLGMGQVRLHVGARLLVVLLAGLLVGAFASHGIVHAQSTVIEVNSFEDRDKKNDGVCTLREAIIAANSDKGGGKPGECLPGDGADTIELPPGTYIVTRSDNGSEDSSTTGDFDVSSDITIRPKGPGAVIIDASAISDRVFDIGSGTLTMSGVTILGGTANGNGGGINVNPGATLLLANSTLTDNDAQGGVGGALYVDGTAELTATAVLTHVTITANAAANGTGIATGNGTVVLRNSIVADDSCFPDAEQTGAISAEGANLFFNTAGCPAGTVNEDPLFVPGSLEASGLFVLQSTSPAIGAATSNCLDIDQLGQSRSQIACDLGAYESPNVPPVAMADAYAVVEDVALDVPSFGMEGILANDEDADGDALTAILVSDPSFAKTFTLNSDGSFSYEPESNFFGEDFFTYSAYDGSSASAPTTVTILVSSDGLIEVNTTDDDVDGDGCTWDDCSLREAINLANSQSGTDTIVFEILPADATEPPYVIDVTSALPTITETVIINGSTQIDGEVVLDGGGGNYDGLVLASGAGGSTIEGLTIRNFGGDGIRIEGDPGDPVGSGGNTIAGNSIIGNGGNGVTIVYATNNSIQGNNITANGGLPIDLGDDGETDNDPGDVDNGANNVQNYPDLIRAVVVPTDTVGISDTLQIVGTLNSKPGDYQIEFFLSPTCESGDQTLLSTEPLDPFLVTIPADASEAGFAANIGVDGNVLDLLNYGVRAIATDSDGNSSEANNCTHVSYGNDIWPGAFEIPLAPDSGAGEGSTSTFEISQYLDRLGQSRWYKLKIAANSKVKFDLTGLEQNFNLAVYKDVEAAYLELAEGAQNINELGAEVASDPLNPSAATADAFRTAQTAGSALNGSALNGSALNGSALNGSALNGSALNGSALNGSALNGSALNGSALNGSALNGSALNAMSIIGSALNGSALNGSALNAEELARVNSSALARTLIAVSAAEGASPESVEINSWNNAGYIYLRVWGNEGVYDPSAAFTVTATTITGLCNALPSAALEGTEKTLSADDGDYETIILTDWSRFYDPSLTPYTDDGVLKDKLQQLANEVSGVIVNVGDDARVAQANADADDYPDCSYGKNLVAESIQAIVDDYRTQNPEMKYVVIVGNDDIIPFYRYPDNALLGPEAQYFVPNAFGTSSYAALRQNYLLTQDQYGATKCISLKDNCFPIPQISVGRLLEGPNDIIPVLDAYLNDGKVLTPDSALVTGYDFLEDAANAISTELALGVPTVDSDLIDPQYPGPIALADPAILAELGLSDEYDPAWTATDLLEKLNNPDFDLYFLAGHFASATTLAGDYKTTMLADQLPADMKNKLIYSAGCHVNHNSVDWHGIPGTTVEPDWGQAFARRGATLIGGTGYQYGDTDFLEYSERLYLYFTEELGKQLNDDDDDIRNVSIGDALVAAKQRYLSQTPLLRGIHEKVLLEATIYGLPMREVDLPSRRIASADTSVIGADDLSPAPDNSFGLQIASHTHYPDLQFRPADLKDTNNPDEVIPSGYWVGEGYGSDPDWEVGGYVSNPGEPIVPLEKVNVTPPDPSLALRGVGLTGACYVDEKIAEAPDEIPDETLIHRIPLTGAPTTEASSAHIRFYYEKFVPEQPWSENYFGALVDPSSAGSTYVDVMPVQYRSNTDALPSFVYTERRFSAMTYRFYFNDAVTADQAELGPPPTILSVSSSYSETAGADIKVVVASDYGVGVQDVWILWTDAGDTDNTEFGCSPGELRWQELSLEQSGLDPSLWTGHLDLGQPDATVAENVRFIVFAAGRPGGVSWATNQGLYYTPGGVAGREATSLVLDPPSTGSGAVGTTVSVRAVLSDINGAPLPNRNVLFGLASQSRVGITGADGSATVDLPVYGIPGDYDITAVFSGSAQDAPSTSAPQPFTVQQQSTSLTLELGESDPDETATLIATLIDGTTPEPNILVEQTVFFEFTDGDGVTVTKTAITGLFGEARLGTDGAVDGIGPGTYSVIAKFKGTPSYSLSTSNVVPFVVNVAPVAQPDTYEVFEDNVLSRAAGEGVLANDTDGDGDALTANLISGPSNGLLSFSADGSFTYTPTADFNGGDSFTYKASDGYLESAEVAVSITVKAVNDPPICYKYDDEGNELALFSANPDTIWPLKKQERQAIQVLDYSDAGSIEYEGDSIRYVFLEAYQDEVLTYNDDQDAWIPEDGSTVEVRKDRNGSGNGRVYHIIFAAVDAEGDYCLGDLEVPTVPHDQSGGNSDYDDGCLYDSISGQPVPNGMSCADLRDGASILTLSARDSTKIDTLYLPAVTSNATEANVTAQQEVQTESLHLPVLIGK